MSVTQFESDCSNGGLLRGKIQSHVALRLLNLDPWIYKGMFVLKCFPEYKLKLGIQVVVAHIFKSNTWKAEAGGAL